jgi:CRP-like cAMP-binding protein
VALTPRAFVDGLIQALLTISNYHATAGRNGKATKAEIDSGSLDPRLGTWGFFTNHALLLLAVAMDRQITVREIASSVGVTERAVVAILNQLEDEGIISRNRRGRRNTYDVNSKHCAPFRAGRPASGNSRHSSSRCRSQVYRR